MSLKSFESFKKIRGIIPDCNCSKLQTKHPTHNLFIGKSIPVCRGRCACMMTHDLRLSSFTFVLNNKIPSMNKSIVIIITAVWLLCSLFMGMTDAGSPYHVYAMAGSWSASFLLLVCIIIYIKKHTDKKKYGKDS